MKKALIGLAVLVVVAAAAFLVIKGAARHGVPFRLVYTGRTYGYLLPKEETKGGRMLGGFDRRSTAIKEATRDHTAFIVDCGGFAAWWTHGSVPYRETLSRFVIEGMNRTGVEVSGVEEFDQAFGKEELAEYAAVAKFPFVSASIVDAETGQYVFEPFKVIERNGLKVAFVGLMDRELVDLRESTDRQAASTLVPGVQREEPKNLPKQGEGFRVLPVDEALDRVAPLVKGKADVTVLLVAGGSNVWGALNRYNDGATFQVVLDLAGRPVYEPLMQGKVPFLMNGIAGSFVGVADFEYMGPGDVRLEKWEIVELTDSFKGDPALATLLDDMRLFLKDADPVTIVDRIYGPDGDEKYVGAEACAACHSQEYEIWLKGPHSRALDSLKEKSAQYDPACVVCHTSDYQAVDGYVSEEATPFMAPINCEVCHGRGSEHVRLQGKGVDAQLRIPDPPRCTVCHDGVNDPGFDYTKRWAAIMHGRSRSPAASPPSEGQEQK